MAEDIEDIENYAEEDYQTDETSSGLDRLSAVTDRFLTALDKAVIARLTVEKQKKILIVTMVMVVAGLGLFVGGLIWAWSTSWLLPMVLVGLIMVVLGLPFTHLLLGRPSKEELKERLAEKLSPVVSKVKAPLEKLPGISEAPEEEDEEEGLLDIGTVGEEEEEGLTTIDPHLESAFAELETETAKAEARFAERTDEEWLAEGIVPPKLAARVAMEAGVRTKELSLQLVELLEARDKAYQQRHGQLTDLLETVVDGLHALNLQIENLVQDWPEAKDASALLAFTGGGEPQMALPELNLNEAITSSLDAPLIGPVTDNALPGLELGADQLEATLPPLGPKIGDEQIVAEINGLMTQPFSHLLRTQEVDEVVMEILAGTEATFWKIRNLRMDKTDHKRLRLGVEDTEALVADLDLRLQDIRGFDDPALRAGLILEGLGDPFYRLTVLKTVFPEGEGEPIPPTLEDYSRIAAVTDLGDWLEYLEQGQIDKLVERANASPGEPFHRNYYLLAPVAQQKLKSALIGEYVGQRRQALVESREPEEQASAETPAQPPV